MEIACPCRRPNFTKDAGNLGLGAPLPIAHLAGVRGGQDSCCCVRGHVGIFLAPLEGKSSLRLLIL